MILPEGGGELWTRDELETIEAGMQFAPNLSPGDVVAITGELGVGKTVFCRGICRGLGYQGDVSSPSFVRMHTYPHNPPIYHVDFYLVRSHSEGYRLGLDELSLAGGIILIEWAQLFPTLAPDDCWWVDIRWDCGELSLRHLTIRRGKLHPSRAR